MDARKLGWEAVYYFAAAGAAEAVASLVVVAVWDYRGAR